MPRGYIKTTNLTKDTIIKLATGGLIIFAAATSPFFLSNVVNSYFKDRNKKTARERYKKLYELKRKKLIDFQELANGKIRIELTQNGKKLVREYELENMKLKQPKKWDKTWRIIAYDIPSHQRKASNAFREKVRSLGLFSLQRSVWVSPYPCLPEIEFLASVFEIDINNCIHHFETNKIPREYEVRRFFNI